MDHVKMEQDEKRFETEETCRCERKRVEWQ